MLWQSTLPPGKCNSYTNHLTGSKELNQLLHQHYCGKKAPPKPSASAVKRGKVPPPPNHVPTKNCPVQQKKSAAAASADTDTETANTKNNPDVTDKKLPAPPGMYLTDDFYLVFQLSVSLVELTS